MSLLRIKRERERDRPVLIAATALIFLGTLNQLPAETLGRYTVVIAPFLPEAEATELVSSLTAVGFDPVTTVPTQTGSRVEFGSFEFAPDGWVIMRDVRQRGFS